MLNRSVSLAMSTHVLKALPGKLDIKYSLFIHSQSMISGKCVRYLKCKKKTFPSYLSIYLFIYLFVVVVFR